MDSTRVRTLVFAVALAGAPLVAGVLAASAAAPRAATAAVAPLDCAPSAQPLKYPWCAGD